MKSNEYVAQTVWNADDVMQTGAKLLLVESRRLTSCSPADLDTTRAPRIISTSDVLKRSQVEGRKPFHEFDKHPTGEGHIAIATCIYKTLQDEWAGGTLPRK